MEEVPADRMVRLQIRMTADLHRRLLTLEKITDFQHRTLAAMALAVGVNALEQSLMAATGDVTLNQLAQALQSGVVEDLDALGKALGEK